MAAVYAQVQKEREQGIGPWISDTSYSTPIYTVPGDQPRVRVQLPPYAWARSLQTPLDQSLVPIPPDAQPANGTDGHLTIYQPATDSLWEFWQARKLADGWHASWGGAMHHVSQNPGYYTNQAWTGLRASDGWNWGSTAASLPVAAGLIRIDELRRGRIDHALALAIPIPCARWFSWPAQRTDGYSQNPQCLPEGAHLRLDPTLDLAQLNLPPITRLLAQAAQRYGLIIRDKTDHATGFYAEDPKPTGSDPYHGPTGLYGGLQPWNFLPPFPWKHLQLLKLNTCTTAPCQPPTTQNAAQGAADAARRKQARRKRVTRKQGPRPWRVTSKARPAPTRRPARRARSASTRPR